MIEVSMDFLKKVETIVTEVMLDKDIPWEILKTDKMVKQFILKSAETYLQVDSQPVGKEDKDMVIMAMLAYLSLENAYLRIMRDVGRGLIRIVK